MTRTEQHISRAELQRRQRQSLRDREANRRHEQSVRDRQVNRAYSQAIHLSTRLSTSSVVNCVPIGTHNTVSIFAPTLEVMPPKSVSSSENPFASLFNTAKYSDVTIYLGKSKTCLPVHRCVLGTRSPYFDDALQSGFIEGRTGEFIFGDDSPHALWRVFQYMYTGDYSEEAGSALGSEGDDLELLKHPRVYALADMFRMDDLKALCCKKFSAQLEQHWISDTFADCIREVYATSLEMEKPATRKITVDIVVAHKGILIQRQPIQEVVREVGDFAVDLVLAMAGDRFGF